MPISRRRSPFQIRNNEFSFGVRHRWALLGNKSGTALEVLGLSRFENSELKEVFRDVTWAYSKYEDGANSCNTETTIASEPSSDSEFFNIVRRHSRSYFGNTRNPEFSNYSNLRNTPVESCASFKELVFSNTNRWDATKGMYLDSSHRFLTNEDVLGKGAPLGHDP